MLCTANKFEKMGNFGLGKKVRGCALEIVTFPDMKHGWSVRGDMNDPKAERDVKKAFNLALAFFRKYM